MTKILAVAASLAALTWAAEAVGPVVRAAGDLEWKASGSLPPGAEYHLIYEDPATHAVQTLIRMPKGYVLPAHSHSQDETILVLRGKLVLEFGARKETVSVGGYAVIPRETVFTLRAAGFGGSQFLATFSGPFDMKPAEPAKP